MEAVVPTKVRLLMENKTKPTDLKENRAVNLIKRWVVWACCYGCVWIIER